jgi:hypothetical protein
MTNSSRRVVASIVGTGGEGSGAAHLTG